MNGNSSNSMHEMGKWYTVKTTQTLRRRSVDCYFEGRDLSKIPAGLEGGKDWPYNKYHPNGKPILDNPPYIRVTGTRIWYPKTFNVGFKQGMMIGYRHIKQGFIYEAVYGYEQYGPGETDIFDFEEYESPYIGIHWFNNGLCGTAPRLRTTTLTKVCLIVFNASHNPIYVLPEHVVAKD